MVGDDDWRFPTPEVSIAQLWCGQRLTSARLWQELQQLFKQEFTQQEKEEVWSDAVEVVNRYYDGLVVRWKEEMDTLLVYVRSF